MAFNVDDVLPIMLNAAKGPLAAAWGTAEPFAKTQFANLAQAVAKITEGRAANTMSPDDAKDLFAMEKDAAISALAALDGVAKVAAETAVNNALSAVTGIVNGAVGFALL